MAFLKGRVGTSAWPGAEGPGAGLARRYRTGMNRIGQSARTGKSGGGLARLVGAARRGQGW